MQTAVIPANSSSLKFYWDSEDGDTLSEYYLILHILELQSLTGNNTRQFDVHLINRLWYGPFTPDYLRSDALYSGNTFETGYRRYNVSLNATRNSTLPPILNALEIYTIRPLLNVPTDIRDEFTVMWIFEGISVDAIMAIKVEYQVKKNWMGDPCTPKDYAWDGVSCNASMIIAINLSSSGLTGVIASSFARFKAIEYLDLSYNNLTGPIPDFLADLSSLQVFINDDKNPCIDENSCPSKKNKKKITAPIIAILSVVGVVLLLVLMFIAWRMRQRVQGITSGASMRPGSEDCSGQKMDCENYPLQSESRQFTHMQLVNITNNFVRVIGKGGFGMVYHGYSENGTEVAVKLRSQSSSQGAKEFLAEVTDHDLVRTLILKINRLRVEGMIDINDVPALSGHLQYPSFIKDLPISGYLEGCQLAEAQNLTRIHHRNLVSLVGYCKDGNYLALVYEYMPQGSLREHLNGITSGASMRPGSEDCSGQKMDCENYPLQSESRQFTHMQLVNITNNFVRVIGKGGFGMVYHGYSENGTEVAVKLRSQSSSQGAKEFLAEVTDHDLVRTLILKINRLRVEGMIDINDVPALSGHLQYPSFIKDLPISGYLEGCQLAEAQNLTRIHHRNLVSLVGYCKDGNYLALVYEYMPQGSLREHLNGCTFTQK
ncbi:hypothetical protein COCNU_06G004820 [Cocos nucifera]|uniref:non-specific serine/threonine protein kinase n=1 Tax=Cocos nucifera TaxID=13894 RepID=A0A8K0IAB9_COCNU|nr:hypothetical protein COCNU_06G004820 [Cocos nucifera]